MNKVNKSSYFAIQIDETTDVTKMAQFLYYIRYEDESKVGEDIVFCYHLTQLERIYLKN